LGGAVIKRCKIELNYEDHLLLINTTLDVFLSSASSIVHINTKMTNLQIITTPRPLTSTDKYQLRYMFKEQLQITNNSTDDDKQDADDIIDFAFDMVDDGKTVGNIIEEVSSCMIDMCTRYVQI